MNYDEKIAAFLKAGRRGNHPHSPGKRLVGWVVDEDLAGLSDGLFVIEEMEKRLRAVPAQGRPSREDVALALMNSVRSHHGLDPIKWDFPAISSWHRKSALRDADAVLALFALPAEGGPSRETVIRGLADFFEESVHDVWSNDEIATCLRGMIDDGSSQSPAASVIERIAAANLSDPATDDLTVPLAIELAEEKAKHALTLQELERRSQPETDARRPQDWIVQALDGFLDDFIIPDAAKAALVSKMLLACTGIQGEVEVEPFKALLSPQGRQDV